MKLTVQQVFDATQVVARIIREAKPMPQKGKYRLARLHAKLLPEYQTIAAQRDGLIIAYGYKAKFKVVGSDVETEAPDFSVPPDKVPEFNAAWAEIAEQEIEVDVEPIPLNLLDLGDSENGAIEAADLVTLGELVKE